MLGAILLNSAFLVYISYRENRGVIIEQSAQKAMMSAQSMASMIDAKRYEHILRDEPLENIVFCDYQVQIMD